VLDDFDVAQDCVQLPQVPMEVKANLVVSALRVKDAWAAAPVGRRLADRKHWNVWLVAWVVPLALGWRQEAGLVEQAFHFG
jgi:hypothetical protein